MNKRISRGVVNLEGVTRGTYATPTDFCAIFGEETDALYSLALLLTGNHEMAEKCFLAALDDCRKANDVFRDWARSWSRRAVIKQAIQQVHPRPEARGSAEGLHDLERSEDILGWLLQLRSFERFVFGMAILERYTDRECATLLDCHPRDVERARIRALRALADSGWLIPLSTGSFGQEPVAAANIGGNV